MNTPARTLPLILAALIATGAAPARANEASCGALFSAEAGPQLSASTLEALDELVRLKAAIDAMTEEAGRALAVRDFQVKARQIAQIVGPDFKRVFEEHTRLGDQRRARLEEQKKKEEVERAAEKKKQEDVVLHLTRPAMHPLIKRTGPWLDDSRMIVLTESQVLKVYDYREKKFVPHPAVDALDLAGKYRWQDSKLILSSDKKTFIVGSRKEPAKVLDLDSGASYDLPFPMPDRGARGFKFTQHDRELVVAGEDGETIIYSFVDKRVIFQKKEGSYTHGQHIVQSPDARWIFVIRSDGNQVLYDLVNRRERQLPNLKQAGFHHVFCAAFSADSRTLTLVNHNEASRDYDIASGTLVDSRFKSVQTRSDVFSTKDGKYLVATRDIANRGNRPAPVSVYDLATGAEIPLDFSAFVFHRPDNYKVSEAGDVLFFRDSFTETGKSQTSELSMYALNLTTLQTERLVLNPSMPYFTISKTSPDGNSVFTTTARTGEAMEIH